MNQTSISIVIAVYKLLALHTENFPHLLASIARSLKQTDKCLLKEIVIINDFPEENVEAFIRETFEKDGLSEHLHLIQNQERSGHAVCRNTAFGNTTGQYVHFIDHDDWVSDNFYDELLQYQQGQDILMAGLTMYANYTNEYLAGWKNHTITTYEKANTLKDLAWFLISNIAVSPGQYLIKRETIEKIGGFPVLLNKGSDDYGILFLLTLRGATLSYRPTAKLLYRLHAGQGLHYLNLNQSVAEFFAKYVNTNELNWKLKLVRLIKTNPNPIFRIIQKVFYVCFFNRYKK